MTAMFRPRDTRPLPRGMVRLHMSTFDSNGFTVHYEDLVVSPEQLGAAFRALGAPLRADALDSGDQGMASIGILG